MQHIGNVAFLQALGYAIINSAWQFALLWVIYFLVNLCIRLSPHHKYVTGVVLQFAGLVWFVVTLSLYTGHLQTAEFARRDLALPLVLSNLLSNSTVVLPYVSMVYCYALLFFFAKWMYAYRYTAIIKKKEIKKIPIDFRLYVQKLSMQLGIYKKVNIYLSGIVSTPLTLGFLKPVILIPLASINGLSVAQMETVILHELIHIKRHDYLVNLAMSFVEILLFFNPFMHLLSKEIKHEREHCCDDWVIRYQYDPAIYVSALLAIATPHIKSHLALYASGNTMLLSRIKRIVRPGDKVSYNYKPLLAACLVISVFMLVLEAPLPHPIKFSVNVQLAEIKREANEATFINESSNKTFLLNRKIKPPIAYNKRSNNLIKNEMKLRSVSVKHNQRKQLEELSIASQNDPVADFDEASKLNPAVFILPQDFDEDEMDANRYLLQAAARMRAAKKLHNAVADQPDKIILIELPSNMSDTIPIQVYPNGKVLKSTRL